MSKQKPKRRLGRKEYLARKQRKIEIRARPPAPIPEELRRVDVSAVMAGPIDPAFALPLAMILMMKARSRMRRKGIYEP